MSLDLWASHLEVPVPDLDGWLARLEGRMASAAARGAQMLVLPEFACAQWLCFSPPDLPRADTLGWLARTGAIALPRMAGLAKKHRVSLLPGTIPEPMGERDGRPVFANRAHLLTPGGEAFHQDKLSLTPYEEFGEDGATLRGEQIDLIEWNGLKIAIVICLDVERTALWPRLARMDLDLVVIPAKTEMITGYNRVFACARSRAIELQTPVCVVGAVGSPLARPETDPGVGGAAAYLPCDVSVSLDGVFAVLPARSAAGAAGDLLLHVADLPVGQCRRIREGAAEAELRPGTWPAAQT